MMLPMYQYPTGQVNWSWLNYRVSDNLAIDLWRYAVVLGAFFLIGAGLFYMIRVSHKHSLVNLMVIINVAVAVLVVLQEVEQFGKPMLAWRLPYETALIACCITAVQLSRKLRERHESGR